MYADRARGCDGDGNAGVGPGEVWLRGVSVWVVYVVQVVSTTDDVLEMSVVRGV